MNRSVEFSPNEVFLYFYLLNECNIRGWQNPFEHPNKTIVLATGISEKTVIEVRNRLQQKGLITFESGKKNAKSPVYYLLDESKTVSKEVSKTVSKRVSKTVTLKIRLKTIRQYLPYAWESCFRLIVFSTSLWTTVILNLNRIDHGRKQ